MIVRSKDAEQRAAMQVAELMAAAARTAPKGKGVDNLETLILTGEEKDRLADEMLRIGTEQNIYIFERDSANVRAAQAIILLGVRSVATGVPNCGYCGFENCGENAKNHAVCAFNNIDLGIAIGSAVSVAANHRVDNRVLFTAGKTALLLKLFETDVRVACGVPLSVTGKSPFFDRAPKKA